MSKPDDFRFIQKKFGGNTGLAALRFDYWSDKKHKEIEEFYTNWAAENGWQMLRKNRYVKGNQTVVVEFEYHGNSIIETNVYISCEKSR